MNQTKLEPHVRDALSETLKQALARTNDANLATWNTCYARCLTPDDDSRPLVAILGSRETYAGETSWGLPPTSTDILGRRPTSTFHTERIFVYYGWQGDRELRDPPPAVILVHASAFNR